MRLHCAKCGRWCAFDEFGFPRRVQTYFKDTGKPAGLGGALCRDNYTHDIGPESTDPDKVEFYLALR